MKNIRGFAGIFPYLVSPLDADGWVLEAPLRRLVESLIGRGVHGLSPLGSTGEVAYLSPEQRLEIVKIVVDQVAGRVPVVPGVAAYATRDAVRQAHAFQQAGADGLVVILQVMFPLKPGGMTGFYRQVAAEVGVPLVLYTNPGVYGVDLTPEILQGLVDSPAVEYIKDASGSTGRIQSILNRFGERFKVFSASAHLPAVVFQLGGVGWMAGPACAIPELCVQLYEHCRKGEWEPAYALQRRIWGFNELFQKYALAGCIKAALNLQGFEVGEPVAPQEALPPAAVDEISACLGELRALPGMAAHP